MNKLTLSAVVQNSNTALDFIHDELEQYKCSPRTLYMLDLAIEELFVNIANYGYPDGNIGSVTITSEIRKTASLLPEFINASGTPEAADPEDSYTIRIQFIDDAIPYNPLAHEDPDISLSAEERNIGGLGIFLVKKYMDKVEYKYLDNRNVFTIYKIIK
ncbi:MAG: ATP-binding protein [Eubacteriales bacterium]|nr:ATP-binding protein [Eubacteriales bacterium]